MIGAAIVGVAAIFGILIGIISEKTGYIIIAAAFGGDLILYRVKRK